MSTPRTNCFHAIVRLAAAVIVCALGASSAGAQNPPASTAGAQDKSSAPSTGQKLTLGPCRLAGWKEDVRCGRYEVFEDRAARAGRKISLRIVVVPAVNPKPQPDPVFYFMGGPGASAVDAITGAGPSYLAALRKDRDLVFVDQRGTGGSNPLVCDLYGDKNDMAAYFSGPVSMERLKDCRAKLEKVADLTLYSTPIAIQDLDEVRAAMGYDKINLYGGSYGSTAALAYLRQYPQRVRTVTVVGVAPPDMKLPLPFAKGVQHSLDRVFADCAADAKCREAFPDVKADFEAAAKRLESGPVTFDALNLFTKKPQPITLTRNAFGEMVRVLLYSPEYSRWIPLMMKFAARGDYGMFAAISFQFGRGMDDLIARGMHYSVACPEFVAFITDADITREMEGTFYGTSRVKTYRSTCEAWPKAKVDASFATPVKSDAPVLMLSGDLDPVTPAWLGAAALKSLPNGRQVIGQNWAHSIAGGCADDIAAQFVSRASVRDLNTDCVDKIRRPPFATPEMLETQARNQTTGSAQPAANEERWQGVLEAGGAKFRLILKLSKSSDGSYKAVMDSPDQNAYGLVVDTIVRSETMVKFEMNLIGGSYEGKFSPDSREIIGQWMQGGQSLPLTFRREVSSPK